MSSFDEIFSETKLGKYKPPPPWLMGSSSSTSRSRDSFARARIKQYPEAEVRLEQTKGDTWSVKVYDTSYGRYKLKGRTTGMDRWEAKDLFEEVCKRFR